jgi:hypothetical protein
MTAKEWFKRTIIAFLPYLLILISSIVALYLYLLPGINSGDDMIWHLTYIYDLYYGFKNGFAPGTTSHVVGGIFAVNIYLFYAPLPHYIVVILTLMFEWCGATLIGTMKFVSIASIFFSSVFLYFLAKRVTSSRQIATLFGIAFCFFPYRLVDFLYRAAFAEAIALSFIPMLFYGVYRILHDEKPRVAPYVFVIAGMSCLVLSHPFTALMCACAVGIVILFNTPLLIKRFQNRLTWLYCGISVVLIFGFVSCYFFPMALAVSSGYYRISDAPVMWTTVEHIAYFINNNQVNGFSGILNFSWLDNVITTYHWTRTSDTIDSWIISLSLFLFSGVLTVAVDYFLRRKETRLSRFRYLICLATTFIPCLLYFPSRIEIYLSLGVFYLAYLAIEFSQSETPLSLVPREIINSYALNGDIYAGIVIVIISFFMLYTVEIWAILPSVFLNAQFSFRVFAMLGFGLYFLLIPLSKIFKGRKTALVSMAFVSSLLFALCQAPVDKRIAWANGQSVYYTTDYSLASKRTQLGSQDEYFPNVFFIDYTPVYPNSLYGRVKTIVNAKQGFPHDLDDYLTPVFLKGDGSVSVTALNTPNVDLTIVSYDDDSLIQLPQFYYEGYRVTLTDTDGKVITETPHYMDGLLSFDVPKGTYTAVVDFPGTTLSNTLQVVFYLSFPATVGFGCLGLYFNHREKRKEKASKALADKA